MYKITPLSAQRKVWSAWQEEESFVCQSILLVSGTPRAIFWGHGTGGEVTNSSFGVENRECDENSEIGEIGEIGENGESGESSRRDESDEKTKCLLHASLFMYLVTG